ncbi:MAG: LPP20 family lipoprotein [Bacteroidota bacterium]
MKSMFLFLRYTLIGIIASLYLASCGSKAPQSSVQRTEITLPFADHLSDKEAFRGVGMGKSPDQGFALDQARLDARTFIAQQVQTTVKSAVERYREQYDSSEDTVGLAYNAKFEELTRNLVDQSLNNVMVDDQKMYEVQQNNQLVYEAHVAMTLKRDDFVNAMEAATGGGMSDGTKLKIEYDRKKFREIFEQEMQQLKQDQARN